MKRYSSLSLINRPRELVSFPGLACLTFLHARNPGFKAGRPSCGTAFRPRSQSTTTISPVSVVHRIISLSSSSAGGFEEFIFEKMSSEGSAVSLRGRKYGIADRIVQSNGRDDSRMNETAVRLYNSMTWS